MDKNLKTKSAKNVGTIIGIIIVTLIVGFIGYKCYNIIAYEFNLPTLNYWVCTGTIYVLKHIFKK